MFKLLIRWLVLAVGVTLATKIVPGISCTDTVTLCIVVLLLSLFNVLLKPLLMLFALPFIILTLGLGIVLINALLLYWTGSLVEGFHVAGFWAAFWGAIVISLTNIIANRLIGPQNKPRSRPDKVEDRRAKNKDVIDI